MSLRVITLALLAGMAGPGFGMADRDPPALPERLKLEQARTLAVRHNPSLAETKERLTEQEGRLEETRSSKKPKISLLGDYGKDSEGRLQKFGEFSPEDARWNLGAEASITVYAGGLNRETIHRQEAEKEAVHDNVSAIRQDIMVRVYEAFLDALLARETTRVRKEAIEVLEAQRDRTKAKETSGAGTEFEVLQAEVAVANAKPPLIRAENDYRRAVDRLRRAIGLSFPPGVDAREIQVEGTLATEPVEWQLEGLLKRALENRPELKAVDHDIEAAVFDGNVVKSQNSPVVDVFAGYGAANDQFGDDDVLTGWTVGARLNWAFMDGGKNRGRRVQAESRKKRAILNRDALRLEVEGEVRQTFYDFEEARGILESTTLAIAQAEEALRQSRNRYDVGRGTQLDVLESQLQLTRARLESFTAQHGLRRAMVRLRKAVGEAL